MEKSPTIDLDRGFFYLSKSIYSTPITFEILINVFIEMLSTFLRSIFDIVHRSMFDK